MINPNTLKFFRKELLKWFQSNGRDFPWRKETASNYELIISEILLQRTRAETVARYYPVFFSAYPSWEALSTASLSELEEILHPLGLYQHRAKRLQRITEEYKQRKGKLPANKSELQDSNLASLYISNAYELFILKKRSALLDVNMARLLSRFFNPGPFKDVRNDKPLQELAARVTDVRECKSLNWSILDYAALICLANKPKCQECPLASKCAFYQGMITPTSQNAKRKAIKK